MINTFFNQIATDFNFIKEYWTQISLALGAVGTFFIGRKKREIEEAKGSVEIDGSEIKNVSDLLDVYKEMHLDLGLKIKLISKEYNDLEIKFKLVKQKLFNYESKISNLESENTFLRKLIDDCSFDCVTKLKKQ